MKSWAAALAMLALGHWALADEPPLPSGLGAGEPALPTGLGGAGDEPALPPGLSGEEPALPTGLGDAKPKQEAEPEPTDDTLRITGFAEARYGHRVRPDPLQTRAMLAETRLHLEAETGDTVVFRLAADLLGDAVAHQDIDLRAGEGPVDLREATVFFRPADFMDIRLGRQIMTWGTGDLIFINDVFPKDFESFFAGRDDDYLKVPADAVRLSLFSDTANLDVAVMPYGAQDRLVDGSRMSFTDPATGQSSAGPLPLERPHTPEAALRAYRTFGSVEAAAYGFWGRWKSPAGVDPVTGKATFPRLGVYGASLRGPVLGGIANLELGYLDSRDDRDGTDPLTANSEWRAMAGFEREILPETTLGVQYATTFVQNHSALRAGLPPGSVDPGRRRDVATIRLTRLLLNQTLTASGFLFHSPTQGDGHLRLRLDYQVDDHWSVGAGANLFYGDRDTPFGQFARAGSVVTHLRYGF